MRRTTKLVAISVVSLPLLSACSADTAFVDANEGVGQLGEITGCEVSEEAQELHPAYNGVPPFSSRTCTLDVGEGEELYLSVVPEGEEPLKIDDSFPGYYGIAGRDLILADNNWELHATSYRDEYWPAFKDMQKEWGGKLIVPDGVETPDN
ncbi:hypothetical protein GCM10025784_02690 [Citricoccus nitrophenolicus]